MPKSNPHAPAMRLASTVKAALLAVIIFAATATRQPVIGDDLVGDPGRGLEAARALCGDCHLLTPKTSPGPGFQGPSFQEIADTPGINRLALIVFFGTPHRDMPNLVLDGADRDDIIAYILSLQAN